MMPVAALQILLEVQGQGVIRPAAGQSNKFRNGQTVVFTSANPKGLVIKFQNNRSPFGSEPDDIEFSYGVTKTIRVAFDPAPGADNKYPYDCSLNGQPQGGGGEVIIVGG